VLGLQVDGDAPRLRREFKDSLRQHLHYLEKFGPIEHANARNFDSVWGMKCHIRGLIDYANMVEPEYAGSLKKRFNELDWPV
jgi:RNA-directed DNA polymerase